MSVSLDSGRLPREAVMSAEDSFIHRCKLEHRFTSVPKQGCMTQVILHPYACVQKTRSAVKLYELCKSAL